MLFSGDFVVFLSVDFVVKVHIMLIPTRPTTVAMPVVLSPKIFPSTIRNAPVKHRDIPNANSTRCRILILLLFNFYTSLSISNFMLYASNIKLNKYNIALFKSYCSKTKSKRLGLDTNSGLNSENIVHLFLLRNIIMNAIAIIDVMIL